MWLASYITDVDAAHVDLESSTEGRKSKTFIVTGIFGFCTLLSLILAICVKEDLRRVNYKK